MDSSVAWSLCVLASYLVGSIPFGLLIGLTRGVDVRRHGSGNIGATNVGRVLGRRWGSLAFGLDVAKGGVPVLGFGLWLGLIGAWPLSTGDSWRLIALALATILGHIFPVYLRFRGGKGVATGLGALTALWPLVTPAAVVALATWIVVVRATRYVSVASCMAAIALPLAIAVLAGVGWPDTAVSLPRRFGAGWPFLVATALLAVLVIWKHRGNLARVRAGIEPKIGRGGSGSAQSG